jgi:para-nitrobenzyl esterase
VPRDPITSFGEGQFRRVPMIVGINRDEGRLFIGLAYNLPGNPVTAQSWATEVDRYFGPRIGAEVRRRYPLDQYPDAGAAFGQAAGDANLACPAIQGADVMSKYTPVHLYEYAHTPNPFAVPTPGIDLGAFHTSELPYVFNGAAPLSGPITFTEREQALVDVVTSAWTRFAANGTPSAEGVRWPRLGSGIERHLVLDTPPRLAADLEHHQCDFWERVDLEQAHRATGGD